MLLTEILDRNVRCNPEEEAILDVSQSLRYSYGEVGEMANRCTNFLTDLGMKKGDRVAVMSKNRYEYLVNIFGVFQGGGVFVPINWRLSGREIEFILNQSDADFFVFERDFLDGVQAIRPNLKKVRHCIMIGNGEPPEGILSFENLMKTASVQKTRVDIQEGDAAVQMYTSGTTGVPKGALLTHRSMCAGAFMSTFTLQTNSDGRLLYVAPLFHVAAMIGSISAFLLNATVVLMNKFDAEGVLDVFENEKITNTFFAPSMIRMLLDVPGVEKRDLSSLNTLSFGGAPITYELLVEAMDVLKCDLSQGFGQTEASPAITRMSQQEYRKIRDNPELKYKLKSVGKDFPGIHIRIVDENDNDVPIGEVGEIICRGDNVMLGYYNMPEETEKTLRGGWLHTGDVGKFDEEHYLYLVDRKKDMIISGGENIYSLEIESVISKLKGVVENAVVGMPHEKWGEVVKAFVVQTPDANLTQEAVIAFCKENIASFKCPKEVAFLDILPRNAAGKVLKKDLKELS